jgi:hypothetical protein
MSKKTQDEKAAPILIQGYLALGSGFGTTESNK